MERPARGREAWDADEALEQLYAAHWRSLVRLSVLLLHDQGAAEEVVQDAFVAMHGRWHRLRDPDKALAYLRQAVVNRSRSALRHRGVVERHAARAVPRRRTRRPPTPPSVAAGRRDGRARRPARAADPAARGAGAALLPGPLRGARSPTRSGISRGAVKAHASRGSATLRELLADQLSEGDL